MYIIVSYGTKISEVASNVQSQVKYTLNQSLGLAIDSVNILYSRCTCSVGLIMDIE